ncbi:hypothetical protein BMETH_191325231281, partial [methanotrophic bacterial endosymbiont of Bathymodiolus sp.]
MRYTWIHAINEPETLVNKFEMETMNKDKGSENTLAFALHGWQQATQSLKAKTVKKIISNLFLLAMLVTFQAQASVTVEEAMAIHDEMKADADMRADISRSYRNFMRIWPNSVKRAERVLQQYYRLDAIRYKAQLAFESEYSIWYTSGLYRDSVKVEKKWLTLLNHVSTRLVIDN